jgi:hypothetical protein
MESFHVNTQDMESDSHKKQTSFNTRENGHITLPLRKTDHTNALSAIMLFRPTYAYGDIVKPTISLLHTETRGIDGDSHEVTASVNTREKGHIALPLRKNDHINALSASFLL